MGEATAEEAPPPLRVCSFFKVFFLELYSHRLEICRGFRKHMKGAILGRVSLMGPSGSVWEVELTEVGGELFFRDGWGDFARDHSLQTGDFLVFEYGGCSIFNVLIFDRTACEKKSAFIARPGRAPSPPSFEVDVEESGGEEEEEEEEDEGDPSPTPPPPPPPTPPPAATSSSPSSSIECVQPLKVEEESLTAKKVERCSTPKRKRSGSKKKCSSEKSARSKTILVSHRRPVEEDEIKRAHEAASSFESDHPFFEVVMRKSFVYTGYMLNIPLSFGRLHLPNSTKEIFLRNHMGESWTVTSVCAKNYYFFSAGWRRFCIDNHLEENDACIFEFVENDVFQVHIFRVVEELSSTTQQTV